MHTPETRTTSNHLVRLRRGTLHSIAAIVITFGIGSTAGAQSAAPDRPAATKSGTQTRSAPPANTASSSAVDSKRRDWKASFTPEEVAAWEQKIAAAPDEAEKRKLRGQRLAEIRRRSKEQPAAAAAVPAASRSSQSSR
jgi:hypothetical protein